MSKSEREHEHEGAHAGDGARFAPDAAPSMGVTVTAIYRPLVVHLSVGSVRAEAMKGAVVIVIDALRASVTMTRALASGARAVVPVMTVDEARRERDARLKTHVRSSSEIRRVLLGGERGGQRIDGFDFGNSPSSYTPAAVAGADLVFTTTNGTATLMHARIGGAAEVLVGSFANLGAVCDAVRDEERQVHLLCAGTRGEVSMDDCLVAGAMVQRLVAGGRNCVNEDSGRLCLLAWRGAIGAGSEPASGAAEPRPGVHEAMRASRGGRNLLKLGFDDDVRECSRIDTAIAVPRLDLANGELRL